MSDYEGKLKHLTAEQIEALYKAYIDGEKNAVLIARYGIAVSPSCLIKTFPPVPSKALSCPYCIASLYEHRKAKGSSRWQDKAAFCRSCAHRHYYPGRSRLQRFCTCRPCQEARAQARQEQEAEQRRRIHAHWSPDKKQPVAFDTLSFLRKLQLMALLEVHMDTQRDRLSPLQDSSADARVTPSSRMDCALLQALHDDSILLVDPLSQLDAFSDEAIPKAWQQKVGWIANVSLDGSQRASLTLVHRTLYDELSAGPQPHWRAQIVEALRQVSIEEVSAYLEARCAEHNLPFEARKKTAEVTATLIEMLPVRSLWSLCNTAVRGALSYIARKEVSRLHASNSIPANLLAMAGRAVREQWQFSQSAYDLSAPRSSFSQVLYGLLLNQDDHGLRRTLNDYIGLLREQTPPTSTDQAALHCVMCGSGMVHVQSKHREIIINCKDCMARSLVTLPESGSH
ncbi:hypothetical protein D3C79_300510 [compost metagenome]